MIKESDFIISDVNEEGVVAVHQCGTLIVHLAIRGPYSRSRPDPDYASVRIVYCAGQYIGSYRYDFLARTVASKTDSLPASRAQAPQPWAALRALRSRGTSKRRACSKYSGTLTSKTWSQVKIDLMNKLVIICVGQESECRVVRVNTRREWNLERRLVLASALPTNKHPRYWSTHRPFPSRFPRETLSLLTSPLHHKLTTSQHHTLHCHGYPKFCANTLPRHLVTFNFAIMSSTEPTHGGTVSDPSQTVAAGKGKGKAADTPQDVSMGEDDSSSDEETGAEDEVHPCQSISCP